MPPACWKYVNCVISMPSMTTCQPTPQAPSVGDSQLSSSKRTSCSARSMPEPLEASQVSLLDVLGRGLQDHLELQVLAEPERVLAVAPVGRAPRRLHVGAAPRLGPEHPQERGRMHRPRAHRQVVGLLDEAPLALPEGRQLRDQALQVNTGSVRSQAGRSPPRCPADRELWMPRTRQPRLPRTRCDLSSWPRKWRRARRATSAISARPFGRAAGSERAARESGEQRACALRRQAHASALAAFGPDEARRRRRREAARLLERPAAAGALARRGEEAREPQDPDVEVGGDERAPEPRRRARPWRAGRAGRRARRLGLGDEGLERSRRARRAAARGRGPSTGRRTARIGSSGVERARARAPSFSK